MNRKEEVEKEYIDTGDLSQAWALMASDLNDLKKYSETINHSGIELGFMMIFDWKRCESLLLDLIKGEINDSYSKRT